MYQIPFNPSFGGGWGFTPDTYRVNCTCENCGYQFSEDVARGQKAPLHGSCPHCGCASGRKVIPWRKPPFTRPDYTLQCRPKRNDIDMVSRSLPPNAIDGFHRMMALGAMQHE